MLLLVFSVYESRSQQQPAIFFDNAVESGVQEMFYKQDAVLNTVDSHIYTCGSTLNSNGTYDILITKHNGSNVLIWSVTYSGSGNYNDYAADITFDSSGNILVCGNSQTSSTDYDALVLKYDSDGDLLWSDTYNGAGSGPDGLSSIITDGSNNIYTCGGAYHSMGELTNLLLIKYDSTGTEQFVKTWNNSSYNLQDGGFRMILSGSYVYCYGATQVSLSPVQWKLASVQYYQSTGNLVGSSISYGDNDEFTEVKDIMPIGSNNFIVAGYVNVSGQGKNLKVTRFNQELTGTWDYTFNGTANGDDEATSIELSGGWLYVGGYTTLSNGTKDIVVTKRNHTSGSQQWQVALDFEGEDDEAVDLAGNTAGHIYISGNSHKLGNSDYLVAKLNTSTGAVESSNRWSGQAGKEERVSNLVVNEGGEIYVAGQEQLTNGTYRFALTRWSERTVFAPKPTDGYSSHSGYIKNNGQLRNENGTANENIKFYNQSHRVATYINDTLISYQLVQAMDTTDADTTFKVNMTYSKGLSGGKVYPMSQRSEYHNYYLGHMDEPSVQTGIYNTVVKNGVYTNIDAVYTHSPSGFRHWLVARSGSTTSDIEMSFDGQTSLSVDGSGKLIIATTIGNIVYTKAKAYTLNHTTGVMTLLGWQPSYSITGSSVAFTSFGSWSGTLVLEFGEEIETQSFVVLQNVDWSTMFGSTGEDQFKDVACNNQNDVFAFGERSTSNLIDNVGQVIAGGNGNFDVILVKFNAECEAEYITYYGGSNADYCRGGEIDTFDGELYCVGTTTSSNLSFDGITMEDNSLGGTQDGFYAKFGENGQLLFHTYVGGSGLDICNAVSYEHFAPQNINLIYYVGQTNNGNGWPALVNQQNSPNMGYVGGMDGFIIKRSGPNENVVWSTFFGSEEDDVITDVDLVRGSPVIVGITEEETYSEQEMQLPTDGKFPKAHGANWNSEFLTHNSSAFSNNYFVAYFGDNGQVQNQFFDQLQWCTYFSPANDPLFIYKASIFADNNGFGAIDAADLFITGQLPLPEFDSDLTFPLEQSGWHQSTPGGGGSDAFFMKFRMPISQIILVRSTLYGGDGDEYGSGFAIDVNDNVYMCGQSKINTVQDENDWCTPATDGEFPMCDLNGLLYTETNIDGANQRAFVTAFTANGQMRWSTQYGAGNLNAANAMCASNDKVWMVGWSNENWTKVEYDDNSISDYYRTINQGQDATIARFDIPLILSNTDLESMPSSERSYSIFPNPTSALLNIQGLDGVIKLEILDSSGRLVFQEQRYFSENEIINLSSLASGLYIIRIISATSNSSLTFTKG